MSTPTTGPDLARGFDEGMRFRCEACGNLTRFDVVETATTRRFHHFDLGGTGEVEEEQVLDRAIESVTCRWCGRDDAVAVESAPSGGSGTSGGRLGDTSGGRPGRSGGGLGDTSGGRPGRPGG